MKRAPARVVVLSALWVGCSLSGLCGVGAAAFAAEKAGSAPAQSEAQGEDSDSQRTLSLEDILNLKTNVASKTPETLRDSPGILSIVTREEIEAVGARDMIDILRLVPGFGFNSEVWGVVAPYFRGFYATGISVMVDGNNMVENLYGNTSFGSHFPVSQIERVEVIRGPGSVLYGGAAELTVVNIITRKGFDLDGYMASVTDGQTSKTYARRYADFSVGKKFSDDLSAHASVSAGLAKRSDRIYTDNYGSSYDMADDSGIERTFVNMGVNYKAGSAQLLVDRYKLKERDHYDAIMPHAVDNSFNSLAFNAEYPIEVASNLTITPRFNYTGQDPWLEEDKKLNADYYTYSKVHLDRTSGMLTASYWPMESLNFLVGGEHYWDVADYDKDSYNIAYLNPTENLVLRYQDTAVFGQGLWKNPIANLTAGVRYEKHSQYGSTVVPRLALTRQFGDFHVKGLLSRSFRPPMIEALRLNADILPELTTSKEVEAGYVFGSKLFVTANVFDETVERPIMYYYDNGDKYGNFATAETIGVESEAKYRDDWGFLSANYSYYRLQQRGVDGYRPVSPDTSQPISETAVIGAPQHKFTLAGSYHFTNQISVGPSLVWLGKRYAYVSYNADGNLEPGTVSPILMANALVKYDDLLVKGLSLGAGVYNITDAKNVFVMGYDAGKAQLPDMSREFLVQVKYERRFGE